MRRGDDRRTEPPDGAAESISPPEGSDHRLDADIRRGLARDEFEVFYQPIVSLADGRPIGAEALVRWRHPERGLVGPGDFIPAAEASGAIVDLGRSIVEAAFRRCGGWSGTGLGGIALHVNLSARQLHHPDLVAETVAAARRHAVPPDRIVLEVTESALIIDHRIAVAAVDGLRRAGFRIAVDDIGTGHSSLARLKHFPIDILKIDRSFVGDVGRDRRDRAIVGSVVYLAEALGIEVVAEGVETEAQREALLGLGCRVAQGHLYAPALAAAEFEALVTRAHREPALPRRPHPLRTVPELPATARRRRREGCAGEP